MINSYSRERGLWPLARRLAPILTGLALLLAPVAQAQQGRSGHPAHSAKAGTAPSGVAHSIIVSPLGPPVPVVSSTAGASGSATSTAPIPFTIYFTDPATNGPADVTGFDASDVAVNNGSIASFSGSGSSYSLTVTPSSSSTVVMVSVPAGVVNEYNDPSNAYILQYTAPTVTVQSLTRTNTSPTNATSVGYLLTLSSSVSNLSTANFTVQTTGSISGASVASVSPYSPPRAGLRANSTGPVAASQYSIVVNTGSGAGTLQLRLENSNNVTPTISPVPYGGESYAFDNVKPTVGISSSASTPTSTSPIPFTLTFSENVTGFAAGDVTVTNGSVTGNTFSGTSPGTVYNFTVTPTGAGAVTVNVPANVVVDGAGNFNTAAPSTYSITYAPITVQSLTRTNASPTKATSVGYLLTLSGNVSGLSTANFTLLPTNLPAGASVTSVTPLAPLRADAFSISAFSQYSIMVNTGSGSGTVQLQLTNSTNVSPTITGLPYNGEIYSIDKTAPVPTVSTTSGSPTSTTPIPFSVGFSESVTGFDASDVAVTNGTLSGFVGSGANYSFSVTPTAAGAVTVSVAANQATDAVGNNNVASNQVNITYAPITVLSLTRANASPTKATSVSYLLTLSGNVSNLSAANFTVLTTGGVTGASVTSVSPYVNLNRAGLRASFTGPVSYSQYTVVVNTGSGSGTVQLQLTNSDNVTPTITGLPYNGEIYSIDKTAPTVSITSSADMYSPNSPIPFTVTFSENVTGFVAGDVTVTNGSVTGNTVSGSGTTYSFTVTPTAAGDVTVNVPANVAVDGVGNGNTAAASAYTIIYTPITVRSLVRSDDSPTKATSVRYQLSVSASIGGLNAGNFTVLTTGGVSGAYVTNIEVIEPSRAGQGANATSFATTDYYIDVNTGSGSGTVQLQLTNSAGVTPTITGLPYDGEIYSIDKTAPTAVISSTAGTTTSTTPIPFTVTFSEDVFDFSDAGVLVTNGTLSNFDGSGAVYTFSVTPTAAGPVTVTVAANVAFDAVANGNDASPTFTLQYAAAATTWTGAVSTDWFTAGNWTNGVPTVTLDAIIPVVGSGQYPQIGAGTGNAKNLTVNSGATLKQTGGNLIIKNDFVNRGTFAATGGTVSVNGSTAQHLGSSSTRTTFWNLTVGASTALLEGPVDVQRLLTLNGNLTTQGNPLTLLSNATATALVVNSGGSVIGTATMQRYIDPSQYAGTGYRHYSSPVVNTTVGDLATTGFTPVVDPRYNTDPATARPFPNVFGYNEARITGSNATTQDFANGYFSPQDLSSTLVRGRGYTVNISTAAKVALTGTLTTGTVPVGALSLGDQTNSGWQLLGNPYPAPLDWNLARTSLPTGVIDAVYVYKPSSLDEGTYQFYQNGVGTLPGGLIGAMQGFFVRVSQPVAAFSFQNAWRATSYSSPAFNRTTADTRPQVQLDLVSAKGTHEPAYVYFEAGATAGVDDHYDAAKLPNSTGLNLASVAAGQGLAVNGLPLSSAATVVPLTVGVPTTGTYSLQAAALLNLSSTDVYLHDAVTGQQINLRQQASYSFTASNAALITGRFSLHFGLLSPTATQGGLSAGSVSLYPNPAQRNVTVALPAVAGASQATLRLLNVLGQPVLTRTLALPAAGVQTTLDVQAVPRGVYVLRIQAGTSTLTKQLVVN